MAYKVSGKFRVFFQFQQKSGIAINQISSVPGEAEVLLRRGTHYEILKVERFDEDVIIVKAKEIQASEAKATGRKWRLSRAHDEAMKHLPPPEGVTKEQHREFLDRIFEDGSSPGAQAAMARSKNGKFFMP